MSTVISIESLWKEYRLGVIGHGTLTHDLQSWWARVTKKEDPNKLIGSLQGGSNRVEGDRFWALRGVDLNVQQGEVLGIIGRNGAGKSTLLKILSRVTAPSQGTVKVKGRIASLLEVGTGFHPELTGRENVFLNGAILGMSKDEVKSKVEEIIEFSGVKQHIETPVKRYSSGMHVRLAFAVAAHLDPEILVIDEVLAVGDAEFQKKCLGKIGEVASGGRTVLFVSHNMGAIQNLCSKVVLLNNGIVEFEGNTREGVKHYLSGNNELVSKNLNEREDRKGSGSLKAVNFYLNDIKGNNLSSMISGQPAVIIVEYKSKRSNILGDVELKIKSMYGVIVSSLSNVYCGVGLLNFSFSGQIRFQIDRVPLPEGSYFFDLMFREKAKGALDVIENAGYFRVERGNFYKNGIDHKGIQWGLLVDHKVVEESS